MLRKLSVFPDTRPRAAFAVLCAALTLLAYSNRFIQDDAFISFRYADNFVRGHGLVWNEGKRVEGYTNFLWTMAAALPLRLGIDPVRFSFFLGLAAFVLSLFFTYRLATLALGSRRAALLSVLLLGTNHTFSSYATGGLETQWQACAFAASAWILVSMIRSGDGEWRRLAVLSGVLGIAVLTRIDSVVLGVWEFAVAGVLLFRGPGPSPARAGRLAALLAPFAAITGVWFLWKFSYYGALLPNTFYAKEPTAMHPVRGLYYVATFLVVYWLAPFAVLFPFLMRRRWRLLASRFELLAVAGLAAAWTAYVVSVGGDFMEYRFLVPVLPCAFVLLTWTLLGCTRKPVLRASLVVFMLAGSVFESRLAALSGVQTIDGLSEPMPEWKRAGEVLRGSLSDGADVVIATTAAGAIPFYSRLRTVDMAGLNDPWVARHGTRVRSGRGLGPKIGHQRLATLSYLLERRVSLVLAHPWIEESSRSAGSSFSLSDLARWSPALSPADARERQILLGSKIVEIPLRADRSLFALYLVRNSAADAAMEKHGWLLHPISRD